MSTLFTILAAMLLHVIEAIVLCFYPGSEGTIALASLINTFGSNYLTAAALLVASSLAAITILSKKINFIWRIIAILPQQGLLFITAFGALSAIIGSQYADAVIRPFAFILVDQWPRMVFALIHVGTIMEWVWHHKTNYSWILRRQ